MGRQRNAKRRRILHPEAVIKPEPNEKVRLWLVYVGMGAGYPAAGGHTVRQRAVEPFFQYRITRTPTGSV
jgi:hypothetical protein